MKARLPGARDLLPAAPIVVGLALAGVWLLAGLPPPIFFLRAGPPALVLLLSLLVAALWAAAAIPAGRARRRCAGQMAAAAAAQSDAHRRFLRRLDHETKNPLTAIRAGLANMSLREGEPALASVRGQVDRLARLLADLRKLADLETAPIERGPVRLDELLAELQEMALQRPEAQIRRILLTVPAAPWPLPPVAGDRDLLFLALHNLVDNALKFTRPGDTVELRASEDVPWVTVEVADTGPGITEEDLPHLGEELYRGACGAGVEGSGLGLALARAIATRHGGILTIRSRAGQGTAVTVRLPTGK